MGMGLASESYLRISNLRECYRVVSLRKPYVLSMLKAQEYDVSPNDLPAIGGPRDRFPASVAP